ncbi:MAG: substrate-binding domain-containing protein [Cyanobacteria bacterium J06598_3]
MNAISQALGKGFEGQYAKTKVEVGTKDANAAIQDVLKDNADLAAISRPLTEAEKAQGLISVPVRREKIAIVVGKDNSFAQSITGSQFAQIFRGEIKDWSGVGGTAAPIRMIDRPDVSETRAALAPYPVFTTAEFKTGENTTQLSEDSTDALAQELGKDGIGYVLVSELADQSNIKALELHKTPPSDPRYPFSQPYAFVYSGEASEAAAAFLGYATGNPGQVALENANLNGGYSILPGGVVAETTTATAGTAAGSAADTNSQAADTSSSTGNGGDATAKDAANGTKTAANGSNSADANGANTNGTDGANSAAGNGTTATAEGATGATANGATGDGTPADGTGNAASGDSAVDASGNVIDGEAGSGVGNLAAGRGRWWWLLLPLAALGLLIWAAGKRGSEEETGYIANTSNRDDETIRSNAFRSSDPPDGKVGASAETTGIGTGLNKAAMGGTAIAGGVAAAGAGIAGRMKSKAGDITMDLDGIKGGVAGGIDGIKGGVAGGIDGIKGGVTGGIDGIKGGVAGGLGNLRSNVQGGIDSVKGGVAGGIDNVKGGVDGVQGNLADGIDGIKGNVTGSIDGIKGQAEGGLSGLRANAEERVDSVKGPLNDGIGDVKKTIQGNDPDSWLDRAKQRINEATDQIKDSASDIKDDINKD